MEVKAHLEKSFPRLFRGYQLRWGRSELEYRLEKSVTAKYGRAVLSGPFLGMQYVEGAVGSAYWPKILGSYESELHDVIETIVETDYTTIIDVGCAEGYYAIGLASRSSNSQVYAFDTDSGARQLCTDMAAANSVSDRVIVEGHCDPQRLNTMPLQGALLISDCEGYELEFLRPDLVPGLRKCDILVELHDFIIPGLTPELLERFRPTHSVELIDTCSRDPNAYQQIKGLSLTDRTRALDEVRPTPMQWAWMRSKKVVAVS